MTPGDEPLCSPFIISGRLLLSLDLPSTDHRYFSKDAGDWSKPGTHEHVQFPRGSQRADIARSGEHMHCHAALKWNDGCILAPIWVHHFELSSIDGAPSPFLLPLASAAGKRIIER